MVNQYCAHSFTRNWQLPFLNQWKGENDRRKYFMIKLLTKECCQLSGGQTHNLLITSRTCIQLSNCGLHLLQKERICSPLEQTFLLGDPFSQGAWCVGKPTGSHSSCLPYKIWWKNLPSIFSPLNNWLHILTLSVPNFRWQKQHLSSAFFF